MKNALWFFALGLFLVACNNNTTQQHTPAATGDHAFDTLLSNYWEERMQLFPMEATANGDNRYNDRMTILIADSFRDSTKRFFQKYPIVPQFLYGSGCFSG